MRQYPVRLGHVKPGYHEFSQPDLLQHEGKAVVHRSEDGLEFQAVYESDELVLVAYPVRDLTAAVETLEWMLSQMRLQGDNEVQALLPALKDSKDKAK